VSEVVSAPDLSKLDVPTDRWTQPFWDAASRGELVLPRCGECGAFRWPPGPFCPRCRSQEVAWAPAGEARLYSYTLVRQKPSTGDEAVRRVAPALVEFPACDGVRIMAAIVDTPAEAIRIGARLELRWAAAGGAQVPQFAVVSQGDRS
jgi:uncharacterized protein